MDFERERSLCYQGEKLASEGSMFSHRWGVFIQCINMFMIFDLLLHFLVILNVITSNVTSVMESSSSLF